MENEILRLISGGQKITLRALDGTRTIFNDLSGSTWKIDDDFEELGLNKPSQATKVTDIEIYEMKVDAKFKKIFNSFLCDLSKLVLTQDQIIEFCQTDRIWFKQGCATYFLISDDQKNFFVVGVHANRGLYIVVHRLEEDKESFILFATNPNRFVVPQQTVEV